MLSGMARFHSFFLGLSNIPLYIYIPVLFIHSSMDGLLGCFFHTLAIGNSARQLCFSCRNRHREVRGFASKQQSPNWCPVCLDPKPQGDQVGSRRAGLHHPFLPSLSSAWVSGQLCFLRLSLSVSKKRKACSPRSVP